MKLKSVKRSLVVVAASAGSLIVTSPRSAHAEDAPSASAKAQAESLVQSGIQLRKQGNDEQALGLFKRALALDPTPKTRAQVGLAELALGYWADAEQSLSRALESGNDAWIQKNAAALRAALKEAQARLGTLEIAVNVAEVEVLIDGASRGTLTGPLRLPAGIYSVEIRREGYHPAVRRVEVEPTKITRESLSLSPVAASETPAAGAPVPAQPADAPNPTAPAASGATEPRTPPAAPPSSEENAAKAASSRPPRKVQFEFGTRLGYGIPLGEISKEGPKLKDALKGQVPIWFDAGVRLFSHVFVGAYLGIGVGIPGENEVCAEFDRGLGECSQSALDLRLGLQAIYHFRPPGKLDPWVGIGFGYELANLSTTAEIDQERAEVSETVSGLEMVNLQAGLDIPIGKKVGLGPFLTWTAARYGSASSECSGDCGDFVGVDGDIENTTTHGWLFIGARATFVL